MINALAAAQGGRVGHRQLRERGVSRAAIARRRANGRLIDVTDGPGSAAKPWTSNDSAQGLSVDSLQVDPGSERGRVYATTRAPTTRAGVLWTALLSAPADSWVGHLSGCAGAGTWKSTGPVHVVHKGGSWNPPRGVIAHRSAALAEEDVYLVGGVPHTRFARSLVDAARDVDDDTIDEILDEAVKVQAYDELDLRRVLAARRNIPGADKVAQAMGRLDCASGQFRSDFERRTTRLMQRSSLIPRPVVNVLVDGFRPDIRPLGTRGIIECDGRDYHRSLAQIRRDEEREAILRQRGFVFHYLRWHHVKYEEDSTLARIERFVLANLAPPVPLIG